MTRLHFKYEMQIEYSEPVARCNFTIKCIPKETARQHIENANINIIPPVVYHEGIDGLKNLQIYGVNEESHKIFNYQIEGDVVTGLANYEEATDDNLDMVFAHPYGLNKAGDRIKAFYDEISPSINGNILEKAAEIMHCLYEAFGYKICCTDVNTTAEQAFAQGLGVCQDYAHIYISLLHLAGISARYVTGLIVGEGASHAWVEVLDQGKWYGFDPTNNIPVSDYYIKIGVGRDAKDCMINRGIMHGGGLHLQTIKVNVTEE